jgi:ribose 5-phosphate isomerase B
VRIAVGCDHAGFPLKSVVLESIRRLGHEPLDLGTSTPEPVDYPDIAEAVGRAVLDGRCQRGIVVCGSGVGAAVAANKLNGIRSGVCHDTYSARQAVEHDDVNVLSLGARVIGPALAESLIEAYLGAAFSGEARHARRLRKVADLEARSRRGGPA